ncbi:class I SAM-dependent methyltransferase [Paenibacillus barcinonensis]|uniref:class I SAM-dependent methyltransferase n=1 Tax=Paenibacillus barcinonensis TaxID=198119 RepID=UPI001C127E3E|nr:class I SAM-dependent methyltransferase [Paenibacillus barcinonensis]MBU5354389.1 class I SAM-dependent methyltransferase [Paenibacillus barcinonensis]
MIEYDTDRYLQYMELTFIDEVKKDLELQFVNSLLQTLPNPGTILDIGTATARYPIFFANKGFDVVGVDKSLEALKISRENVAEAKLDHKVKLYEMDATMLEFPHDSFDLVTCMMGTICHLTEAEKKQALANIWYVLKPNGTLVLTSWNPECSFNTFLSFYTVQERELLKQNSLSKKELISLFIQNDFRDVSSEEISAFPDEQILRSGQERGFKFKDFNTAEANKVNSPIKKYGQLYAIFGKK